MEVEAEKDLFLSCIKEKLYTFKVYTGEEQGQVAFCFDVSHIQQQQPDLKQARTMYFLFDPIGGRDCFFFSHCSCENFDELLQAQLSGCGIALRNLQQGFEIQRQEVDLNESEQLSEMRAIEGFREYKGEMYLSSDDKIAALTLLESSLVSEVELIGQIQFKPAVIYLNRLLFREILHNESVLSEYLVKIVWKIGQQWQEISSVYLLQSLRDIISVINAEHQQLSHLVAFQPSLMKYPDQLKLFWPIQDLTDHSSPYNLLKDKQTSIELKPGQHIFFRQKGAISLLRSSQTHGIYLGQFQVLYLGFNDKQELKVDSFPLENFLTDTKQVLNVCEYGMPEFESLFKLSGSYCKSSSDHPFKVLLRAQLILTLKNPIIFSRSDTEVDAFTRLIKTGQFSNKATEEFSHFIEQVISAFCDTFFVSLGD